MPDEVSGPALADHDGGSIPRRIDFGDVGTLLVRLSRPLPGPVFRELDAELARRHLDLTLAGLQLGSDETVDGPGVSRAELSGG